jgi:hypothetical protein
VLRDIKADDVEFPSAISADRLLILTGCRLGEIMTFKWDYVDLDAGALRLPDPKTAAKVVLLGQPAFEMLKKVGRVEGNQLLRPRCPSVCAAEQVDGFARPALPGAPIIIEPDAQNIVDQCHRVPRTRNHPGPCRQSAPGGSSDLALQTSPVRL